MSEVTIEIRGDASGVEFMLERVNTALSAVALVEFMTEQVAPFLGVRAKERFKNEGDDAVGKWAPLGYMSQRIRSFGRQAGFWTVGDSHPINRRDGELEEYITSGIGYTIPTGAGDVTMAYPDPTDPGFNMSTELKDKISTAQRGRTSPSTVPRPVLGVSERDMVYVLERLALHITGVGEVAEAVSVP